jgi:hypothetical protein
MKRLRESDPRSRENSREWHAKLSDPIDTDAGGAPSAVGGRWVGREEGSPVDSKGGMLY